MPTATINGIAMLYERGGDGPPLLFLNGSGSTLEGSQLLLGVFRPRFDLLAHDQRGLGGSGVPPGPYEMADYAADALALLDHVGWERCRVVGISFGGMVAQELAVNAPGRVERLALLCTSAGGDGGASYPLHELDGPGPLTLLDTRFDDEWLATHDGDRALVEMMASRPSPTEGMGLQLDARSRHDVWDRLDRITCPTLVAGGRYDGIAPPDNSERIASRIPDADLRLYEGGHAFVAQDRDALPQILDWLEGAATR